MAEALRVVLDTNTVLSALLLVNGRLMPLRAAWQVGELTPLLCAQTVKELRRKSAGVRGDSRPFANFLAELVGGGIKMKPKGRA